MKHTFVPDMHIPSEPLRVVTVEENPAPGWPSDEHNPTVRIESDHYVTVDCSSWDEHAIMRALDHERERGWRLISAHFGEFMFERIRE